MIYGDGHVRADADSTESGFCFRHAGDLGNIIADANGRAVSRCAARVVETQVVYPGRKLSDAKLSFANDCILHNRRFYCRYRFSLRGSKTKAHYYKKKVRERSGNTLAGLEALQTAD